MNCKPNGELLTIAELWEIANCNDALRRAIEALHNEALIRSRLLDVTAKTRFEMFMRGELELDSTPRFDNSVRRLVVNREFASFFTRNHTGGREAT